MTLLLLAALLFGQKFKADDPVRHDNDAAVDVKQVAKHKLSDYYDFLLHTFGKPGDRKESAAANINTLGEVPDSSWFQNRHATKRMTTDELGRGPNSGDGPSLEQPWSIIDAKTEGITPGFRIRDARGDVYFIKFDPVSNPEMATAAEVISTKFFYAMGYNVPENYITFFKRAQVRVDEKAKVSDSLGRARRMTEADLDQILKRVHRNADGSYRVIASKMLKGTPVGPFQYYGTRPDDPNDIFPHENRRELRGLRVISAWLNHDDSRAINSLDMLAGEKGSRYVKHFLIDFGSTLGSGSIGAQKPRAGWEYMWEPKATLKRIATLGLWDARWIRVKYPEHASIGRFESAEFKPEDWKPEYPNPAFLKATDEDTYWAAKLVMAFTDEDIRAIVKTGRLSDPRAEDTLLHTLIERRDKVGRYWLTRVSSFDRFELSPKGELRFEHLASYYDFAPRPDYRVRWFRYDNFTGARQPVERLETRLETQMDSGFHVAEIESDEGVVSVYVRHTAGAAEIIGIERKSKY